MAVDSGTLLVGAFEAFGKSAVIAWPGQTSEQAGGERAGKKIRSSRRTSIWCERKFRWLSTSVSRR